MSQSTSTDKKSSKKAPWKSKTIWVSVISALAPLACPPLAVWIQTNPELFSGAIGVLFMGLRLVTNVDIGLDD